MRCDSRPALITAHFISITAQQQRMRQEWQIGFDNS
jgi:hypothetical protein